jgi:hypothetical protein
MVCMMYDWINRILHVCAKVPKVGITCGVSVGGTSLSHGIGVGSSTCSTYKADDMYTSERLTGTSRVALMPLSKLEVESDVSDWPKQTSHQRAGKLTYMQMTTPSFSVDLFHPPCRPDDGIREN